MAHLNPTHTPPAGSPHHCPSRDELRALLHGDLDGERSDEMTAHVGDCGGCQGVLEAVASGEVAHLPEAVRHLPRHEPPPALWKAIDRVVHDVTRTSAYKAVVRTDADADLAFLTPTDLPDRIGTLGRFEVIRMVGRGGMGVVLHAFDPDLQRDVALKVLDPDLSSNRTARERFCREARAAAAVTHENIVTVHQVNEDEHSGLPYLVMQLVNGESLEQRLRRVRRMSVADAARLGAQAAAGLSAAHAQGLIHRDVKPGNILIEAGDKVKLTDFGLARAAEDLKLTRTGYVSGTPLYMAPEQAAGADVDARADLFSLGVVLYEAVAGQPPFEGKTPLAVLRQVADTPHRPLRKLAPGVPEWFEDVIDGLLAKDPADRVRSAAEVVAVLSAHTAGANGVCDSPASLPCPVLPGQPLSNVARRKYRRRLVGVLLMPFLLGLGVGAVGVWGFTGVVRVPPSGGSPPAEPVAAAPPAGEPGLDTPRHAFPSNFGAVWSAAACPDKRTLATGHEDGTVRLYDLTENRLKNTLPNHKGPVWGIDFHPRNEKQFVTASDDGTVKLWDLSGQEPSSTDLFTGTSGVRAVAYSPDGEFLAVGERGGKVTVLNMADPAHGSFAEYQHGSSLTALAFSPVGSGTGFILATAGSDKTVRLWRAFQSERAWNTLPGHIGPVYAVAFSQDGKRIATAGWDKTVRLWDVESGVESEKISPLVLPTSGVWSLAFTPCCGYLAAAGQDGTVRVWDAKSGKEEGVLRAHTQAVHVVRFARDDGGRHMPILITGGRDGAVRLWDLNVK